MNLIGANLVALACVPAHPWARVYWVPGGVDACPAPDGAEIRPRATPDMLSPDGTVIIGYRELIPVIDDLPMIGFHPSLLPHGRGRCPVQWAILAHELCGMSFFRMAAECDAGPILGQLAFGKLESSAEFYDLIQAFAPHLLRQVIRSWACTWEGIPQARKYPAFPALDDYRQECMSTTSRDRVYSGPYKPLRRYQ